MDAYQRHDAALVDAALLLTLWKRCAIDVVTLGSRTRLMKLAFLAAARCAEQGDFYFNLQFHQWRHGPSSNEVLDVWPRLQRAGLIEEEEVWELTDRGAELAEDLYRDLICKEPYLVLRGVIDELSSRWKAVSDDRVLCEHVNGRQAGQNGTSGSIGEANLHSTLVSPPSDGLPLINLDSETAWVETLALSFSPHDLALLQRAVEDFRAGRFHVA